mgnify:CR=1 FL=1
MHVPEAATLFLTMQQELDELAEGLMIKGKVLRWLNTS